jgi:hypothetical protein
MNAPAEPIASYSGGDPRAQLKAEQVVREQPGPAHIEADRDGDLHVVAGPPPPRPKWR